MTTANATGIIAAITGALAMLCSALLVATYFGFRELQNEWRWLLVLLSLCDFFQGLFYLCATFWQPTQADEYQCMAQTVFGSFFASASFIWTACISYYVRQLIRLDGTQGTKLSWLLPRFHAISWGIPAAVLVVFVGVDMSRDPLDRIAGPVADHDGCYIPAKYVGCRRLLTTSAFSSSTYPRLIVSTHSSTCCCCCCCQPGTSAGVCSRSTRRSGAAGASRCPSTC